MREWLRVRSCSTSARRNNGLPSASSVMARNSIVVGAGLAEHARQEQRRVVVEATDGELSHFDVTGSLLR